VHRGQIVDIDAAAELLGHLLRPHVGGRQLTVVATTPATSNEDHRSAIRAVLDVVCPETVLTIDGVKAAALGARADLTESLLVVDVGAQLTEVALLTGGAVVRAHCTAWGVSDLGAAVSAGQLVEAIAESTIQLVGDECGSSVVDALDRGVLLSGGGALRPEITYKLAQRLGATVNPAPAPQTAAVRGAGAVLQAARRHPSAP
jgi:rod shape-determining protein MreB